MSKNSDYVTLMEKQMKKWDADVDALAAKGEQAGAEASAAYKERVKQLRAGRDAAQKQLQEFRTASEAAGETMQAGMQQAWDAMQKALEKASSDLRK